MKQKKCKLFLVEKKYKAEKSLHKSNIESSIIISIVLSILLNYDNKIMVISRKITINLTGITERNRRYLKFIIINKKNENKNNKINNILFISPDKIRSKKVNLIKSNL